MHQYLLQTPVNFRMVLGLVPRRCAEASCALGAYHSREGAEGQQGFGVREGSLKSNQQYSCEEHQ